MITFNIIAHDGTFMLFGVKEPLDKQGLCLNIIRSNIVEVAPDLDRITLRCPKIPTDTDARIGVRNDSKNSAKKQNFMKYRETKDPAIAKQLQPFEVPRSIQNIIQRE